MVCGVVLLVGVVGLIGVVCTVGVVGLTGVADNVCALVGLLTHGIPSIQQYCEELVFITSQIKESSNRWTHGCPRLTVFKSMCLLSLSL